MNYRHVYHAGNFADVLKHLILVLVLEHLKQKDGPFRVIDTHAGAGCYDLSSIEAQKTGEWRDGVGRLLEAEMSGDVRALLTPYLDVIGGSQGDMPRMYPGSPVIAAKLLRRDDQLVANELHPEDRSSLIATLKPYRNAKVMALDGYVALKSTLPPKERRGVILVDPPFEQPGELQRLVGALRQGAKRFQTGVFLLWFPIKDPRPITAFKRELSGLGMEKLMAVEFYAREPRDTSLFNGHGLVILNPPYRLESQLRQVLPFLSTALGMGNGGWFDISRLSSSSQ